MPSLFTSVYAPSTIGSFLRTFTHAWLTCAATSHNLTRAAGHHAAGAYATARPATIRTRIITVAARLAHRAFGSRSKRLT
jgi:hypothetical protein